MLMGILLIVAGILAIFSVAKGMSVISNKLGYFIGSVIIVVGIILCVLDFIGYISLRYRFLIFCTGLMFVGYNLFKIYRKLKCTKEVEGVYLGSSISEEYKFNELYSPEFEIKFNNEYYENVTWESYSKKYIDRSFKKGERYKVFMNPENPYDITVKRFLCLNDMYSLIMGVVFVILAIIWD